MRSRPLAVAGAFVFTPGVYPERELFVSLDEVLQAKPERICSSSVLSEEGGRFYRARNSYRIIETDLDPQDDSRWLPVRQLIELLQHSHYIVVQARTLIARLHAMVTGLPAVEPG